MSRVHLSKADVTELEEQYVLDAIRSGWVAPLGPHVDAFEAEIAARAGVSHALALASGTAALHLGLLGHCGHRPKHDFRRLSQPRRLHWGGADIRRLGC